MSVNPDRESPASSSETSAQDRERRRKLAEVFGDVLPEGTSDDRADGWGERDRSDEDWLRSQVPPHHG